MAEIEFQRDEWSDCEASYEVPGKFGFNIRVQDKDFFSDTPIQPRLTVALPHQCDAWDIAYEVIEKDQARKNLMLFIEEAQAALEAIDYAPMGDIDD